MKNNKNNRRSWWLAGIVISVALFGLLFIGTTSTEVEATTFGSPDKFTTVESATGAALIDSAMPSMFRMVSALVIVIACIYVALYLLKRLQRNRFSGRKGSAILEVLETTCVAPKKTISLVRVGEKSVLVGITEGQMNVLTELDADQTTAVMAGPEITEETQPFSGSLTQAFKRLQSSAVKNKTALES